MKPVLVRGAILLLAGFELVVAYAVLHPRVSEQYRAYFISRSDFMSPWQHEHLGALARGTHTAQEPGLMLDGWDLRDDGQCWNWGRTARIVLRVDGAPPMTHALVLRVGSNTAQHALLTLNGARIRSDLVEGAATIRLEGVRAGENTLRLDLPDARPIGPDDPRMWALRLDSVTLE